MAEYPAIVLTNIGLDMIAESQTGRSLIFSKLKIGDGLLGENESISALTALKSPRLDIPIQGFLNQGNGQVRLRYLVDNSGVPVNQGFFAREVGVYAKLGETGTERLYAYSNGGNKVDWIPDKNTPMDAQIFDIFVLIGNASNVTVVIDGSATYATVLDLTEHNEAENAHGGRYLAKSGGIMTGSLTLAADPIENMEAATKQYVKNNGGLNNWHSNVAVAVGDICYSRNAASYKYMECTQEGITAAVEPEWPAVDSTVTDGSVIWIVRDIKAINNKAPIASPVFSGSPTAPTPAKGDSSTKIATTEFITRALGENTGKYVIETYYSGNYWYRLWSDNWVEQGGSDGSRGSYTFLKSFADTKYNIVAISASSGGSTANRVDCLLTGKTTTGFSVNGTSGGYHNSINWYACGYAA